MADVILIVLQLDLTCLRNTARLLQLFQQFDGLPERVKLVVNRAGSHESEISLKKAEETLQMPISWQIPNATKSVHRGAGQGRADRRRRDREAAPTRRSSRSPRASKPFAGRPRRSSPAGDSSPPSSDSPSAPIRSPEIVSRRISSP